MRDGQGAAVRAACVGFIGVILCSGCPAADVSFRTGDIRDIISVLVNERLHAPDIGPEGTYMVLVSESRSLCSYDPAEPSWDCIDPNHVEVIRHWKAPPGVPALAEKLFAENQKRMPLPSIGPLGVKVARPATIREIFEGRGGWDAFYARFPGSRGFMEISIPVFSADARYALTYVEHGCGGKCGTGRLVYLKSQNTEWRILNDQLIWVS